jgi:toxin YhaV
MSARKLTRPTTVLNSRCLNNDDTTLRAYDSRTDAYRVFKGMLEDGNPPGDWKALLASAQPASGQLAALMEQR